jgi:hypothetical protein
VRPFEVEAVASATKQVENQRLNKTRNAGRKRKRALENKGTTRSEKQLFGNELAVAAKK